MGFEVGGAVVADAGAGAGATVEDVIELGDGVATFDADGHLGRALSLTLFLFLFFFFFFASLEQVEG